MEGDDATDEVKVQVLGNAALTHFDLGRSHRATAAAPSPGSFRARQCVIEERLSAETSGQEKGTKSSNPVSRS